MQKKQLFLIMNFLTDEWTIAWYLNEHAKQLRKDAGFAVGSDQKLIEFQPGTRKGIFVGLYDDETIKTFERLNAPEESHYTLVVVDVK